MGTSVCSLSFYFRVGRSNFPLCFGRNPDPYLPRFIGKPDRLSPKARLLMLARWLPHISMQARPILLLHQTLHHFLTSGFVANGPEPPFDQRDWIVHHPEMGRTRYIIGFFFFGVLVYCARMSLVTTPAAAPCPVSRFDPPSIASQVFKPIPTVGRRLGITPRRGKVRLRPRFFRTGLRLGFSLFRVVFAYRSYRNPTSLYNTSLR